MWAVTLTHWDRHFPDDTFKWDFLMKEYELGLKFHWSFLLCVQLTYWGRVTHICVSKLTIIGSDNGLSPGRRQAIIWTNAGILLIGRLGLNFSEILTVIQTFSFEKMHLKMSSAKWRPFCLGLDVLTILQHWFRWCLGVYQAINQYLNQRWLVYWRIYASFGLNEL